MAEKITGLTLWEAQTLAWMTGMKFRENAKKVHDETMHAHEAHLVEFESLRDRLTSVVGELKMKEA